MEMEVVLFAVTVGGGSLALLGWGVVSLFSAVSDVPASVRRVRRR